MLTMVKNIKLFTGLQVLLLMASTQLACTQSSSTQPAGISDSSKILATVNGEPITENQLAANVETLMGKKQATSQLKPAQRRKILESMVMSRLIKQQAEQAFDQAKKRSYEQKARAYKEKIIVNDYLKASITSASVNNEMIAQYYSQHPEKFGAAQRMEYELLSTTKKLDETARNKLLTAYGALDKTAAINDIRKRLAEKAFALNYQRSHLRTGTVNTELEKTLASLQPGEASALFIQQGRPYIVKLLERTRIAPQPLSAVQAEIRKMLVPVALKKAIEQQTRTLKENAKIEYLIDNE